MKKLKLLLPIASIGSVAAIVTPLVTSCGDGYQTYKFDYGEMRRKGDDYPFIEGYAKDHTEGLEEDQATRVYLEAASKNKKILAEDMAYGLAEEMGYVPGATEKWPSNVSIGNIDTKKSLISVKHSWKFDEDSEGSSTRHYTMSNIPVVINYYQDYDPYGTGWWLTVDYRFLDLTVMKEDHNWSMSYYEEYPKGKGDKVTYNHNSTNTKLEQAMIDLLWLETPSHYLKGTSVKN